MNEDELEDIAAQNSNKGNVGTRVRKHSGSKGFYESGRKQALWRRQLRGYKGRATRKKNDGNK